MHMDLAAWPCIRAGPQASRLRLSAIIPIEILEFDFCDCSQAGRLRSRSDAICAPILIRINLLSDLKAEHEARFLGRYIVADSAICHGKPTFRGTRVLVADVLEQVAAGMAWEMIVEEWSGECER
ncbi:MAG: DUF433 domain-containing protein [Acidobacteria bacterium]|nr:DUF433 domain-containing protein [Acidobacteriota bacterium]